MKRYRSTAVVLRTSDFGESDRLVTFFTRDHGKLRAVAKGARRSRKRGFGVLQTFAHLRIEVAEGGRSPIPRIESADLLHSFDRFSADPLALGYGGYLVELVDGFVQELHPNPAVFDLLLAFLDRLDRGMDAERVLRVFELLAADGFGLRPQLAACLACGAVPNEGARGAFSPGQGGYVCGDCAPRVADVLPMSAPTRAAMTRLLSVPRREIDDVAVTTRSLAEMRAFLPRFLQVHLGHAPKSIGYLRGFRTRAR
jgi:DNA repair protein RecO (recombination protein O)